jgi:hypothetical protein
MFRRINEWLGRLFAGESEAVERLLLHTYGPHRIEQSQTLWDGTVLVQLRLANGNLKRVQLGRPALGSTLHILRED